MAGHKRNGLLMPGRWHDGEVPKMTDEDLAMEAAKQEADKWQWSDEQREENRFFILKTMRS